MRKWKVRSFSDKNKIYTVTVDDEGNFKCSCPYWIYHHKDCKHIQYIKGIYKYYNKEGYPEQEITNLLVEEEEVIEPKIPTCIPAKVSKPVFDKKNNRILYPLIPVEPFDYHMEVIIEVFMYEHGIPWSKVKELRGSLFSGLTLKKAKQFIQNYGMKAYINI